MPFKKFVQNLLWPFAIKMNPNVISITSIFSTLISCYFIFQNDIFLATLFIIISGTLDVYDGVVARKFRKATRFGNFLDKFSDKLNDSLLIATIIIAGYVDITLGVLSLILVVLPSYMFAIVESMKKIQISVNFSYSRAIKILIIIIGLYTNVDIAFFILILYGIFSIIQRFYIGYKILKLRRKHFLSKAFK